MRGEETVHGQHEGDGRTLSLIWQEGDEGDPARVIDGDVEIVVATILLALFAN
jgi:hypothetical protein